MKTPAGPPPHPRAAQHPHAAQHPRAAQHPHAAQRRPQGQPTRGKTHANRLRRVDAFLARYDPRLFRDQRGDAARAWVVDLGYGAEPLTTLEMASRLRRLNPSLPVLGVEIDPERVAAALPFADDLTHFRLGGFNLPLAQTAEGPIETARMVRAFNVLRQYDEAAAAPAWARMGESIADGGLLIEGTSDPFGRLWVANLLRKREGALHFEALVFSVRLFPGYTPGDFQAVLPKNLIHHVTPGHAIHDFFADWSFAAQLSAPHRVWGMRQWFVAAAFELAGRGWPIDARRAWLRDGYLILRGLEKTEDR